VYVCFTAKTVYSGLAIDVDLHLLYFSDEGQGQVGELDLNSTDDVQKRIIDADNNARPRSIAIDTVNRYRPAKCSIHFNSFLTVEDNGAFRLQIRLFNLLRSHSDNNRVLSPVF